VRWLARGGSVLVGGGIVLRIGIAIAEGELAGGLAPDEWLLAACWPGLAVAGMAVGWWRPALGGGLVALGLAGFHLVSIALGHGLPRGPWFVLLSLPGLLYLLEAAFPDPPPTRADRDAGPRPASGGE